MAREAGLAAGETDGAADPLPDQVRQPRRDGRGNVDARQAPGEAGKVHMDAITPVGTVEADDETPRPVEIGVHQDLQRAGVERLAERGHAPNGPGILTAGANHAHTSLA